MAKLNGVKTVDMVGGEITKITHEGAEYVRVEDGKAKVGDIAVIVKPWGRLELGDYYEVNRIYRHSNGDVFVYIDTNANGFDSDMKYFRKVDSPTITDTIAELEHEVSTHGERLDALESQAKPYMIGVDFAYKESEKKPEEIIGDAIAGAPQVGDKIRIVDAWVSGNNYKNGDVLTVEVAHQGTNGVYVEEHRRYISGKEFVIIARDESPRPAKAPALKVGDYIKVVKSTRGNEGKIAKIIGDGNLVCDFEIELIAEIDKSVRHGINVENAVKATDAEIADAKRKQAEAQAEAEAVAKWAEINRDPDEYKAGDVVRYVGNASTNGHLVVVHSVVTNGRYKIRWNDGNKSTEVSKSIELITPVERRFDRQA